MRATITPSPVSKGRQRLMTSCAIAAGMAALAYGGPALGQVAANPVFTSVGAGTSVNNAGNQTNVDVTQAQSIISWVPTDTAPTGGDIDVLPTGSSWNFSGSGDYTVLNRFVNGGGGALSRQIALNGTVNSVDTATSGQRGGNIWFYNAGGILIGATGVINVGSLVLTSNDIITTGGLFGPGGEIRFDGAAGSTSAITVNGTINTNIAINPGNSYVALVAPRVVQAGTVRTDGSVAYVAAEAVDIRINSGLFDISVTRGAEGGNAITHTGTTTGPAHQQGDIDQSRIYMVAIPKNDAVTMLVSGAIGYDDALSAQVDPDGAVRLSAGYNVVGGEVAAAPANATAANITAGDTLFRSDTVARASGAFIAAPTQTLPTTPPPLSSAGQFFVEGNGTFIGDTSAALNIGTGQSGGATGELALLSGGLGAANGNAAINVSGGSLSVTGTLAVQASGEVDALTGDSQGGTASLTITGGSVSASDVSVEANGIADLGTNGLSGTGQGGIATIDLLGGTINAADMLATADGQGGAGAFGTDQDPANIIPGGVGGLGSGGTATINIEGAAIVGASVIQASALGIGGVGGEFSNFSSFSGVPGTPGAGGDGIGGGAAVNVLGGSTTASGMIANASGIGGQGGSSFFSSSSGGATGVGVGGTGGAGRGGVATIALGTPLTGVGIANGVALGTGGAGGDHNVGGNGGDGFGGIAQAIVRGFDAGELAVTLDSTGTGGNGAGGRDGAGGNGGNGTGGTSGMLADGAAASLTTLETNFITGGIGGNGGAGGLSFSSFPTIAPDGGNGGNGQGGAIEIAASEGATVTLGSLVAGDDVVLGSVGRGGIGGAGRNAVDVANNQGGNGGNGGSGAGGTIRLIATGGTISSNAAAVDITANGISGEVGVGGLGQGGGTDGASGATNATRGGRVVIEASAGVSGPGQIDLGLTNIAANGDSAGRIEIRADGDITFAGLDAQALGLVVPTNNDTEESLTGIFIAPTSGTIASQGDVTLTTDGSVGVYAQSNGMFDVDGILTIAAGDQIDIRHDARTGTAATLQASDSLIATAATSISAAPGSLIGSGDLLSLTVTGPNGTIGVDRLAGNDIALSSLAATSVEHAEAVNDFTATAGSFRTGLNSIITGGDISITSPGAVDLGNSTAGGFVQVQGQSIAFSAITAGLSVGLSADGTAAGAEGINGGSIAAGGDINLFANSIALTGNVTGAASFFAFGTGGAVSVNDADVDGTISIFSAADLSGTYVAGGNIFLNSNANIDASAQANGGYVDGNGFAAEGNLFVIAAGDATLTDSSAARMFGVNAGTAALIDGGTAGEDILVIAGTTANLTDVTGGDDITVRAAANIDALNVRTIGTGADTHILDFSAASGSPTFTIGTGEGSQGINGADMVMASTAGAIDAAALSAGDDILLNAANGIAVNGATTLGLGTTGGDSSVRTQGGATMLGNVDSFSDIIVDAAGAATLTGPVAAGRNVTINAASVGLATLMGPGGAIDTLTADGNIVINSAADISGGGTQAFGDIALTAGTIIDVTHVGGGTSVALNGPDGITAGTVSSSGATSLDSAGGNIRIGGLDSSGTIAASANAIRIEGGGDMNFTLLNAATGNAYVRGGGDFSVASGTVAGTADLGTQGEAMTIGNLSAANAIIENSGGFLNLDTVTVAGDLAASALASLGINGVVTGQSISLASAGIGIAPTGRVGTAGVTQQLSIENNNADNQSFVGGIAGPNGPNGYHIDADELTRVYGTQIDIFAPEVQAASSISVGSAAQPDVVVDTFTMTGGASNSNLGANGALTIRTPGKMRVIGNVQLTGLSDANALNLVAGDALEVILGQGSVRLLGANNAPGGQLNMQSDDIIVATQAAITAVGTATTIDAINTRLGQNDGVALDEGALVARGIRADVAGGFYVQNSGAGTDFAQRRGLTFGAGGLDVQTQGTSRIVINGVQLGANGPITDIDAVPLLTINGSAPVAGSYDPRSTFNGCFIASPTACTTVAIDFENSFPVQDVIDEEVEDDDGVGEGNTVPQALITMRDIDPMTGEPLLDDPVTGAGNDDLWTPPTQ